MRPNNEMGPARPNVRPQGAPYLLPESVGLTLLSLEV